MFYCDTQEVALAVEINGDISSDLLCLDNIIIGEFNQSAVFTFK